MKCRNCNALLEENLIDLGFSPVSNGYLTNKELNESEKYYPLIVKICDKCWLVQTVDFVSEVEMFNKEYAYLSGTSNSWREHVSFYVENMIRDLKLTNKSFVIELASNDGSLLENFLFHGVPCLGVEPTESTADLARQKNIPVLVEFFSEKLALALVDQYPLADLIIGNNVYAHVPDIIDFTLGMSRILEKEGVITLEFPHLLQLILNSQFDTIYHEHYSYLSLSVVKSIFEKANLRIWDVEEISTHGGSLRVYGCHEKSMRQTTSAVDKLLILEDEFGLQEIQTYKNFQSKAEKIKEDLLLFLIEQKRLGKTVIGYGAAAKGNTLLNYAGIKPDLIPFIVDNSLSKQNKFMPGSHIPIVPPSFLEKAKFDYILILPWNIAEEIKEQNNWLIDEGKIFLKAIPSILVI